MADFVTIARVGEIPDGEGKAFELDDAMVAVFNNDGKYYAIDDMCPHMGASLAVGFFDKSDCTVTCPWHAWRFDTRDGTWCDNRRLKIDSYEVRVDGDKIKVRLLPQEDLPQDDSKSPPTDSSSPGSSPRSERDERSSSGGGAS